MWIPATTETTVELVVRFVRLEVSAPIADVQRTVPKDKISAVAHALTSKRMRKTAEAVDETVLVDVSVSMVRVLALVERPSVTGLVQTPIQTSKTADNAEKFVVQVSFVTVEPAV